MEYTIKDKLFALIFPAVCVLYGLLEFRAYSFANKPFGEALFIEAGPLLAVLGGIITGLISVRLKVSFEPYLKVLTIGTVITYLFYFLIVPYFTNPVLGNIFHTAILFIAVFLMTVKMPDEASVRDRLLVTFANPVFYSLINKLCSFLINYLYKTGALAK